MYAQKVKEFSQACEEIDKISPTQLDEKKIGFICQMLEDEIEELKAAPTLTDQMDAFADLIYYILDTCHKTGVDLDPIFTIVHQANMRKVVDGKVIRREDGKILKPKGWTSPEAEIEIALGKQLK